MKELTNTLKDPRFWAYGLFWAWNLIFLAFMLFGFAPLVLPQVINAVQAGLVPIVFLGYAALLVLIPIVSVILGVTLLRREPDRLFAFGYAVEGPLMLLVAVRFFVVRELTPALTFLLVVAALGMAAFIWQLFDRKLESRGALVKTLGLLGLTVYALVALYVGVWLAFYAIPVATWIVRTIFEVSLNLGEIISGLVRSLSELPRNWMFIPLIVFGLMSFAFSATLFVLMPIAVPVLVLRALRRVASGFSARFGAARTALLSGATVAGCIALFLFLNQQPQQTAFALLEGIPTSSQQAVQVAAQENAIRAGLLNAYLAPQRYISAAGEVRHVREMYKYMVGLDEQYGAEVEKLYEVVAAPLLYRPVGKSVPEALGNNGALVRESNEAAELYAKYFDTEIVQGERDTVLSSLASNWDIARAVEALQTADDREVHLNRQELTVKEHGDWADFELHEEYQNETGTRQEVVYYITLPESAVITGVWLGNSDNLDDRFMYRVAPRGAAQAVYRNELRRNMDPALVEQIGPRQYRVRVFPLEPKSLGYEDAGWGAPRSFVRQGPPLHLWLNWKVLADGNRWTLPYLAEKRNVYWDNNTVRSINGQLTGVADDWLPRAVPASTPIQAVTHRFDLPGGQTVIAQPLAPSDSPSLPSKPRFAVVVDRSRSMASNANQVNDALGVFRQASSRGNQVDLYLSASPYRGEAPTRVALESLDASALTFIGGQNPAELLAQFSTLRGTDTYDAVFVLTDGTGYALGTSTLPPIAADVPVWFIHLDGKFPLGYDDATLELIQASGGGVSDNVQIALDRFAIARAAARGESALAVSEDATADQLDGYLWLTLPTEQVPGRFGDVAVSDETFAPFAARRLILDNLQRERAQLKQLDTLDQLHFIADKYSIVSPYSSMLVLVTERQHQLLDDLQNRGDRFDRETEEVGDTQANPFDVTAVPEPHEYVLMAIAGLFVLWYVRSTRRRGASA